MQQAGHKFFGSNSFKLLGGLKWAVRRAQNIFMAKDINCIAIIFIIIIIMFNISIVQISIWIWWNALYNSRGNQINIAQITILQLLFTNEIKSNVGFWWEGKTGVPGKKPLMSRRTNKLNPHMTPSAEIEPGPHWWKASALTTIIIIINFIYRG